MWDWNISVPIPRLILLRIPDYLENQNVDLKSCSVDFPRLRKDQIAG